MAGRNQLQKCMVCKNSKVSLIFVLASYQGNSLACNLEFCSFYYFCTGYASYQGNSLACLLQFFSFNDFSTSYASLQFQSSLYRLILENFPTSTFDKTVRLIGIPKYLLLGVGLEPIGAQYVTTVTVPYKTN